MIPSRRLSVAPMMDWTDRHDRYFLRLFSRGIWLYTEMVTSAGIKRGDWRRLLAFDPAERPVAAQLGGSDPAELALAAQRVEELGYDEVNLNVGCPSDRVQSGRFGACLMAEPQLVAECVAAMRAVVQIPVTVKARIGIDELDSYEHLHHFIGTVAQAGCEVFIVHARKAWLNGLSPKQNREIPPLRYDVVHQVKRDFPQLEISLNGGVLNLDQAETQLAQVDGVMIGRAAYQDPMILADVDRRFYGTNTAAVTREAVIDQLIPYIEREMASGCQFKHISRHILGLYQGVPGARAWRRVLSENAHKPHAGVELLREAANWVKA